MDEPLVWFSGSGTSSPRWLHADHQGSIIATSDANGVLVGAPYTYGPYGEPDPVNAWLGSRFRYTGQIALPDAQLYHYKARAYDPALGRFLQTDPVGYEDDFNLYAYVRNDPINATDPAGKDTFLVSRMVTANTGPNPRAGGRQGRVNTGGRHMFVVTGVTRAGDPSGIRFSGGPSSGHDPALVPLQGTGTPTDRDDAAAWRAAGLGDASVRFVQIPSSILPDDIVEGVGNAAVGNPDYDLGVVPGGNDGANSNPFARAIIDRAATIVGVNPENIPNPEGWHPNIDQVDAVQFDESKLPKPK